MTAADYHDMARDIRDLIPLLLHPQAVTDLRLLADHYESLAHHLEVRPGKRSHAPCEYGRQGG